MDPDPRRYRRNVVPKARSAVATVEETLISNRLRLTDSTCRPRVLKAVAVALTVAAVAPKVAPNSPGLRNRRKSVEPGVETAVANLASDAGSRGRSATSSAIVREPETRPSRLALGRAGAAPTRA